MKKTSILSKFLFIATIAILFSLPAFSQKQKPIQPHNPYGKILTEQEKQEKRDSIVTNSDYIIRGSTNSIYFFRDENNVVYEIHGLNAIEVLRGPKELKGKKIYTIHKARQVKYVPEAPVNERFQIANYILPMYSEGVSGGVFFLKRNSLNIDSYLKDTLFLYKNLIIYGRDDNVPLGMDTSMYRKINAPDRILCEYTSNLVEGLEYQPSSVTYTGLYQKEFDSFFAIYDFLLPYGNIHELDPEAKEVYERNKAIRKNNSLPDSTNVNKKKVTPEEQAEFDLWLRGGRPATSQPSRLKSTNDPIVDCEFFADYQHIS